MPEIFAAQFFLIDTRIDFSTITHPLPSSLRDRAGSWIRRNWEERETTGQVRSAGTYHLNWPKPGIRGINAIKPDYTVPGRGGEERAALVSKKLSFPFLIGIGTVICWEGEARSSVCGRLLCLPRRSKEGVDNAV